MEAPATNREFEFLLEFLKRERGFDFTGYKRSTLSRRINKRMVQAGIEGYSNYQDFLQVHPDEFAFLFNTILINVTGFFRDTPAWDSLAREVIPRLVESKAEFEPIRLWSAGCATGEEAYSLAILFAEALGPDAFRSRVKLYATDADEAALSIARQASYSAKGVEAIPADLLEKYFDQVEDRFVFRKDLRRLVIFGRHDLIQDAPISRVDLLSCRNTLMYLNSETQARILAKFHFALNDGGVLFLGRAETLQTQSDTFSPIDLKNRLFMKITRTSLRDRLLMLAQAENGDPMAQAASQLRIREAAFDANPVAQIIVDGSGSLADANERARQLFNLAPTDYGRPLQDLEVSYRPVELRSCIERAYSDRRPVAKKTVEWPGGGDVRWLDVQVAPLLDTTMAPLGASVTFADVTLYKHLQEELEHSSQALETAYEELQSTVEELETTNEELQSTNEELETMNEELQSTNEELETTNEEVRRRSEDLNHANAFLSSILAHLSAGVVVVDNDMHILVWNRKAEDLWGLRADEVNMKHFLNLDIGLPVGELRGIIRSCLVDGTRNHEMALKAVNRRGRPIHCRITCTPLDGGEARPRGAIIFMDADEETPST